MSIPHVTACMYCDVVLPSAWCLFSFLYFRVLNNFFFHSNQCFLVFKRQDDWTRNGYNNSYPDGTFLHPNCCHFWPKTIVWCQHGGLIPVDLISNVALCGPTSFYSWLKFENTNIYCLKRYQLDYFYSLTVSGKCSGNFNVLLHPPKQSHCFSHRAWSPKNSPKSIAL